MITRRRHETKELCFRHISLVLVTILHDCTAKSRAPLLFSFTSYSWDLKIVTAFLSYSWQSELTQTFDVFRYLILKFHFSKQGNLPMGAALVKLEAGGSLSGGQESQKSEQAGQIRLPTCIQPFIWMLTVNTWPERLHKYAVSLTHTCSPCGEHETLK